VNIEKPISDT